jgi:PPOX class probable F420-dependent enzyme
MTAEQARELFRAAPVARLATVNAGGAPHLVPVTFALADADTIITAVDHKRKRTTALQRLANIAANPAVSLLVDHYCDDWDQLWWVRADGLAVVGSFDAAPLIDKYAQYRDRPPNAAVIRVKVSRWSGWRARG